MASLQSIYFVYMHVDFFCWENNIVCYVNYQLKVNVPLVKQKYYMQAADITLQ